MAGLLRYVTLQAGGGAAPLLAPLFAVLEVEEVVVVVEVVTDDVDPFDLVAMVARVLSDLKRASGEKKLSRFRNAESFSFLCVVETREKLRLVPANSKIGMMMMMTAFRTKHVTLSRTYLR